MATHHSCRIICDPGSCIFEHSSEEALHLGVCPVAFPLLVVEKHPRLLELVILLRGQGLPDVLGQGLDVSPHKVEQLRLEGLDDVVDRAQFALLLVLVGDTRLPQVTLKI